MERTLYARVNKNRIEVAVGADFGWIVMDFGCKADFDKWLSLTKNTVVHWN